MEAKKFYAVAGNPILHSKCPLLFNHLFQENNLNCYYTRISPENSKELLSLFKNIGLKAINITSPFKQSIIPELQEIDYNAKIINSVNTILYDNLALKGYNTDYIGIQNIIKNNIGSLKNKKCYVIGAGGASRSAIFGLINEKADVTVFNRTYQKANELAKEFNCRAAPLEELKSTINNADLVISTVNMNDWGFLSELNNNDVIFIDAIYHNSELKKYTDIYNLKLKYIPGEEWLSGQGLASFELFTGLKGNYENAKKNVYSNKLFNSTDNLILIGFSGSGKTETGKLLANKLKFDFIDTDSIIELEENQSINEIFHTKGEDYFRNKENELLLKINNNKKCVISCGGGIIKNPKNRELLKKIGIIVWLYCPIDVCLSRIDISLKPLLSKDNYEITANNLMKERIPDYCYFSDLIISSDYPIERVVEKIYREFQFIQYNGSVCRNQAIYL